MPKYLENQNNKIFPSSKEIALYENKSYMHKYFTDKMINSPKTKIFKSIIELEKSDIKFPIILKGEYSSASSDIHKFNDKESLLEFFTTNSFLIILTIF